jgi:hypothetical protein
MTNTGRQTPSTASTVYLAWERKVQLSENKPDQGSAAWIKNIAVEDSRPWIQTMEIENKFHAPRSICVCPIL